jgi:hypothetical protein
MNLSIIILKIAKLASEEQTAAWTWLEELISPKIRKKFDIPIDAKALQSGKRSAVFLNERGNIVAFLPPQAQRACEEALKSIGKNSSVLPEIYDIAYIDISPWAPSTVCVIEMEKLTPTTEAEWDQITEWILPYREGFEPDMIEELEALLAQKPNKLLKAVIDLMKRMIKEKVAHKDLHGGNVAWSQNGKLKLIDWEEIILDWIY